jgi:hypothetical protein
MTVNTWIDENMGHLYGKKIRIIDTATGKGVGDMLMFYMDKVVKDTKITTRFVFIFV